MGFPAPFGRRAGDASLLRAALPAAAYGRVCSVAVAALRGTRPHDRGSLSPTPTLTTFRPDGESRLSRGGTRSAPAPSPRAPPRVVFLLLLAPSGRFAVAGHCRGSRAPPARRALCLSFLLASFLLPAVCPPWNLERIGLVCPFPAGSPAGRPSRGASRSPLRGCLRALPPPLPLSWSVGWASLPVGRLGRRALCASPSAQRFAPSGLFLSRCRGVG